MRHACILLLSALIFTFACGPGTKPQDAPAPAGGRERAQGQPATAGGRTPAALPAALASEPLAEFQALTQADVDLYLQVLRAAAERVKNMPQADRDALNAFRAMTTGATAGQMPTPEQLATMQRAGDLMTIPFVVAREMGVEKRFSSINNRADDFLRPTGGASSGDEDDAARMSAEQRQALKVRIQRFKERREADAATLRPFREEIAVLQKQVDFVRHPESIPK